MTSSIGPIRLDWKTRELFVRDEKRKIRRQAYALLETFLSHPDEVLPYEKLQQEAWKGTSVDNHTVSVTAGAVRAALGELGYCVKAKPGVGYMFDTQTLRRSEQGITFYDSAVREGSEAYLNLETNPEIDEFLSRNNLVLDSVDGYVELESDERGWRREEVHLNRQGSYGPTEEFAHLIGRFKAEPPVRGYYSLQDVESRTRDEEHKLIVYLQDGNWQHVFAMNEAGRNRGTDPECKSFYEQCKRDFMPSPRTRLYREVCCHMLVVSADDKIVLGRRRTMTRSGHVVPFFPGAWSATIEENMLRVDPEGQTPPDVDLFACAERGVREELNIEPLSQEIRLLSYGLEWGSFAAAFLFLVRVGADFRNIATAWARAADKVETIALDSISLDSEAIMNALSSEAWLPSSNAMTWRGGDSIAKDAWHHTAKARLFSLLRHLEYLSKRD